MQIRIVHRIFGTNVVLKEMGIINSHDCSFCNDEKDSIDHMFWKCKYIKEFWKSLQELLRRKCEMANNITLTESIVLFGTEENFWSDVTFDFIILLAKQYLTRCKFNKCRPLISIFVGMLKARYAVEKYIATIHLNMQKFNSNWMNYLKLLETDN